MALVFYDGFDQYANGADLLNLRAGGLQWTMETLATTVTPGRNGGGSCVSLGQNAFLLGAITTPLVSGYFGFAGFITNPSGIDYGNPFVQLYDLHGGGLTPSIVQVDFVFNVARAGLDIYRGDHRSGGTLIATTGNNTFTSDSWNYFEFFVTIDNASGAVRVRNNGQDIVNVTGLDTEASVGHAYFEGIQICGALAPTNQFLEVDDFYLADTTTGSGSFPFNFFGGDVKVVTLYPVGNSGSQGWTPLTGSNWQEVSETHQDGDTSYNSSATVNAEDLFNFGALTGTISSILAVEVIGCFRKDDAGSRSVQNRLVSGGTEVDGAVQSIPSSYVYISDFYTEDPATSNSWTTSAVNAIQAGYKLVS